MIEELEGTLDDALRLLATETLDPLDETLFCEPRWNDGGITWELQGRFRESGARFHLRHRGDFAEIRALSAAISRNRRSPAYRAAWRAAMPRLERWLAIGRANAWIREAYDPPFTETSFALCRTAAQMAAAVDRNHWGVGAAFVLAGTDVCMIQQCDGPGEFLMIRGGVAFDSWTTGEPHIHGAKLVAYLNAVVAAPLDERGRPKWDELVEDDAIDPADPIVVATTAAKLRRLLR